MSADEPRFAMAPDVAEASPDLQTVTCGRAHVHRAIILATHPSQNSAGEGVELLDDAGRGEARSRLADWRKKRQRADRDEQTRPSGGLWIAGREFLSAVRSAHRSRVWNSLTVSPPKCCPIDKPASPGPIENAALQRSVPESVTPGFRIFYTDYGPETAAFCGLSLAATFQRIDCMGFDELRGTSQLAPLVSEIFTPSAS